ncbi:hypothetical protein FOCC_FOCC017768, partial [Frankliniella occidentalis]
CLACPPEPLRRSLSEPPLRAPSAQPARVHRVRVCVSAASSVCVSVCDPRTTQTSQHVHQPAQPQVLHHPQDRGPHPQPRGAPQQVRQVALRLAAERQQLQLHPVHLLGRLVRLQEVRDACRPQGSRGRRRDAPRPPLRPFATSTCSPPPTRTTAHAPRPRAEGGQRRASRQTSEPKPIRRLRPSCHQSSAIRTSSPAARQLRQPSQQS